MIKNTTSVGGIDPATNRQQTDPIPLQRQPDSVSTADAEQAAALAHAVQASVGMSRSARLAHVEGAIRAGTYHPSASEVASRLLDAAEVDARLQALLLRG
jgi:anti-sigma28 factor (negative regulator of flagellin synthesis)